MKLSDAIMLNGMTKPQGYGDKSIISVDEPCAIGGALQAVGKQMVDSLGLSANYFLFTEEWPWLLTNDFICPNCRQHQLGRDVIWHLNDFHRWTRQQIAEWVATIEPKEPETIEELETAEVVNELP